MNLYTCLVKCVRGQEMKINAINNVLGINLNGQTLDSYMADASEATKNNIRNALV